MTTAQRVAVHGSMSAADNASTAAIVVCAGGMHRFDCVWHGGHTN